MYRYYTQDNAFKSFKKGNDCYGVSNRDYSAYTFNAAKVEVVATFRDSNCGVTHGDVTIRKGTNGGVYQFYGYFNGGLDEPKSFKQGNDCYAIGNVDFNTLTFTGTK